jgi:glyoxylase-like metal-dependent hydrolase (beta-lactamase superfamily II)
MTQEIKTIRLLMPFKLGSVNCYLIKTDQGYILIDTGLVNLRRRLESELETAGCKPGNLQLIILSHGDIDHIGNAAYLRNKFSARLAMHVGDLGMLERGDMFWNRKMGNALIRRLAPIMMNFGKKDRCTPDVLIEDGASLAEYGLEAQVFHTPGHSKGSICILTAAGDLFCGDLLNNRQKPVLNSMLDNPSEGKASFEILTSLPIQMVYPGHGQPFPMDALIRSIHP